MTDLKRARLVCGLRQIDVWAGTGIPIGRLSQAERGRDGLSEPERRLLLTFLQNYWKSISCSNVRPQVTTELQQVI